MTLSESFQVVIQKCSDDPTYYIRRYIQEVLEASIAILIVIYVFKKPFELNEVARMSLIIGAVTLVLEEYDKEYVLNIKQGILFTIGANLVSV